MHATLPDPKDIREMLTDLFGRRVEVEAIDAWAPGPKDDIMVAEFVSDLGMRLAVGVLDLPFVAYAGTAIGLLPPGAAQDMVADGELPESVVANVGEVLNVASTVFNVPGNPHVRLGTLHAPGTELPAELAPVPAQRSGRLDLRAEISGYGAGRIALISV